jgi:hypothetical protein
MSICSIKKDHIDENDIILEKERYPDKGHERGVCQKVCIPPHLRTDKDSFGREGKKISLSRINRRYPDDMPTLKKMRDDIIAKAVELGVEIVGVSRLDTQSKVGKAVLSQAPGMNTVMGFAFSIPKEAKTRGNYNSYVSNAYSYAISKKMHHILLRIARFIEDYGYYAASYTGMLPTKDINLKEVIINENYESNRYGEKTPLIAYELSEMVGVGIIEEDFKTPEFGEYLDWWTEAQYVVPVGSQFEIVDFYTGKSFKAKRTTGANHADCEALTVTDSNIMKAIWGGNFSWVTRPVIIRYSGRKIAASVSSMPHAGNDNAPGGVYTSWRSGNYGAGYNLDWVKGNGMNGVFDVHFSNSTRHSDGKIDLSHQKNIKIAAGVK